ncbi:hypothetical protein HPO96_23610 [Kribbella sandramycini]|uniref:Secretory lipase n=1 Tax=Kribbella sandramycini TaxID=60450 RepID=A0A7Y4L2R6_9ACTN|nr:hypothetical protein [Kribbella sandramycini]MBB6571361.1 hypothetical protein [Kribbella sandramycini]NOL43237.1 hypothetical protein [Kribbella sandramycini]
MTSRAFRILPATLAIGALLAAPMSAFALSQPSLAESAVTQATVHAPRGALVSAVEIANLTAAELDAAAADRGFVDAPKARYDVTVHRLIYRTIDTKGRPTTASGIVVLPNGRRGALPVAEYLHGTMGTKAYAASVDADSTDRLITALFAGAGLAGVAPDYLGLGLGPGRHPYLDTATETSASTDMLLAARAFSARRGVALKRDVLVTGFSQGGRATLGVGRALQAGAAGPFRLGSLHAVASPFDLLKVQLPAVFDGGVRPQIATLYLAYFITSWNRTVGLYDVPSEVFQAPYADRVEELLDGTHTTEEIMQGLPDSPAKLFTADYLSQLQNPTGPLRQAMRAADQICHDWSPRVPLHFYSGAKDTDVRAANSEVCATGLRSRGARVDVRSMGAVDHFGTAMTAYPQIVRAATR